MYVGRFRIHKTTKQEHLVEKFFCLETFQIPEVRGPRVEYHGPTETWSVKFVKRPLLKGCFCVEFVPAPHTCLI